jgi:UDP-N-acetylglucosamine--N-acetylmuramyl-(pentapeptide) pyrophosphoryl-undecaprenol N-acetylglucosamine transferase
VSPRLLITGGGTGGHVSPGLGVAREWQARHGFSSVAWVGRPGSIEERMVGKAGLVFFPLPAAALRRGLKLTNLALPWILWRGFLKARRLLSVQKAGAVLMTGGYVGMPLSLAASSKQVPLVLMEPNAVPGLANRGLLPFAQALCLAYPPQRLGAKQVLTGTPSRLDQLPSKAAGIKKLGLKSGRKTLLVLPGSQAARSINQALAAALPALADQSAKWQVLWMCGPKDEAATKTLARRFKVPVQVRGFIDDVASAYAAADLVLCRSGASTLAELGVTGKPSIQVPYPHATGDHQRANARAFVAARAALLIDDGEINGPVLEKALRQTLGSAKTLKSMAGAAKRLGRPKAAIAVADVLETLCSTN